MSLIKNMFFTSNDTPDVSKQSISTQQPLPSSPTIEITSNDSETHNYISNNYEKLFDSLNQEGYDFYEFFKAVTVAGIDNPQIYSMALMMGQAMDSSITKDKLSEQANYYLDNITKYYNDIKTKGNATLLSVNTERDNSNKLLLEEINSLKLQIENLQNQLAQKISQTNIDSFSSKIAEIQQKLSINDKAYSKIFNEITKVKNNII